MSKPLQPNQTFLARARKKRGWTQAYVAQQVEVSVDAVRQWERGRRLPYQGTIQQLCELFQMPPEALGLLNAVPTSPGKATRPTIRDEFFFPQSIQGTWEPNMEERKAAWELYVELVTRIPIASLEQNEGISREALSSLYSLFQTVRTILRSYGPTIAPYDNGKHLSVSHIAVHMLNTVVRPLLAKWHPLLKDYEELRPPSIGVALHEQQWERDTELRQEIIAARTGLLAYAQVLTQIAGVSSLVIDGREISLQETIIRS